MTSRVYRGRPASPGLVRGTLRVDQPPRERTRAAATTVIGAIAATLLELTALQATASALGSEILQFQIEMLGDDAFVLELLERAQSGVTLQMAIEAVFAAHIAVLTASTNETFAARAADLADLRDRLLDSLRGVSAGNMELASGTVLLAEDLTPSRFLQLDKSRVVGLVIERGSIASHVALLARSEGVPMVMGVGPVSPASHDRPVLLNGFAGELTVDPEPEQADAPGGPQLPAPIDAEAAGPALLPNGERVRVHLGVNAVSALDEAHPEAFDGIGLVRTELLLPDPSALHDLERQRTLYARLFDWAAGRPVTIRLLDAGGDKPIPDFTIADEPNPFLGTRGARLLARRPDILHTQLRAILSAAEGRPVRVLVPMITLPDEIAWFRAQLAEAVAEAGADPAGVLLGMMVETPAAALDIDRFDVDFYALGTNDLVQYTMASSRDSDALDLSQPMIPALLEMIRRVVRHAEANGREVTMCGDAFGSPAHFQQILDCGVRSFTVPGRLVSYFKHFVRTGKSSLEASRASADRAVTD